MRSKVSAQNPAGWGDAAVRRTRAVLLATVALAALAISPVWAGNPGLHLVRFKDGVLTDRHTGPVFGPGGYTMSAGSAMSADGNVVVNGAAQAKDAALTTVSANVTRSYAGKGVMRHVW